MRIAHLTDLHVETLSYREAWRGVGWVGAAYLWAKRRQYDHAVREALVQAVLEQRPDLVIVTGDLTSQNLEGEFVRARALLAPIFDSVPTLVLAGNHDVSTPEPAASRPFTRHFGPWMHLRDQDYPARLDIGDATVLAIDAALPPRFDASGHIPQPQLDRLRALLNSPELAGRRVVLCQHYPIFGPAGAVYAEKRHGLRNVDALMQVLASAKFPPHLILHGHLHGRSHHLWDCGARRMHVLNPGASCYGRRGSRRAQFAVYEQEASGVHIRHWRHEENGFVAEERSEHAFERLVAA